MLKIEFYVDLKFRFKKPPLNKPRDLIETYRNSTSHKNFNIKSQMTVFIHLYLLFMDRSKKIALFSWATTLFLCFDRKKTPSSHKNIFNHKEIFLLFHPFLQLKTIGFSLLIKQESIVFEEKKLSALVTKERMWVSVKTNTGYEDLREGFKIHKWVYVNAFFDYKYKGKQNPFGKNRSEVPSTYMSHSGMEIGKPSMAKKNSNNVNIH